MRLSSLLRMGEEFGKIEDKVRGIVTFRISPYEQRAFANAISKGIPNVIRRMAVGAGIAGPFFVCGYFVYSEVEKEFHRRMRKNPDDYKDDV